MAKFPRKPAVLLGFDRVSPRLQAVVEECNALGWDMINVQYSDAYQITQASPIGAILIDVPWGEKLDQIQEMGIPILCTDVLRSEGLNPDGRVVADRRGAGRLAAEAFIKRGFKDLAFFMFGTGDFSDPLGNALRDVAESYGATAHLVVLDPTDASRGSSMSEIRIRALTEWIAGLPKPLAILAQNFRMGTRALAACEAAGISVPEEVAIACRGDNDILYQTSRVALSGIDLNEREIGRQAVRLMKRIVDGEEPPKDPVIVPVNRFVERRSTDIFAISDPRVAKAVRFMWDHLSWPLVAEDVAAEVGVSLSTIKRAFKHALNRGINAELRRKRLETCRALLRGTDLTLDKIAKKTGLGTSRHLHRAFKRAFNMTPSEYRKSRARL